MKKISVFLVAFLATGSLFADTIELADGRRMLSPDELAMSLSYTLHDHPVDALLAAASDGRLEKAQLTEHRTSSRLVVAVRHIGPCHSLRHRVRCVVPRSEIAERFDDVRTRRPG